MSAVAVTKTRLIVVSFIVVSIIFHDCLRGTRTIRRSSSAVAQREISSTAQLAGITSSIAVTVSSSWTLPTKTKCRFAATIHIVVVIFIFSGPSEAQMHRCALALTLDCGARFPYRSVTIWMSQAKASSTLSFGRKCFSPFCIAHSGSE